ncbi:aminotransferase class III-fold pyridoxal phosphate-dependent enzyme [Agrobacterium tumefaciens]|uniref:aspartate aminotransferase family protein n=1 Tax=Agrobacterium tumefaciens TaxID=358 RepID=UPI001571D728|nr:aminotransferase class III-fold pyridoxal phosphate-dependent enzyme [Agrobacterium tumefaciens]NTB56814.1 aminotransferase class III-fold pyridoxal phosphate-dependent enzyme [Agrobacterium tumefaciens]NTC13645.1 aminotransferase class III-fold pyridoxal phosphate-dependent enzyme [Agrobacterium tumefaciens]NTC37043.1 aminotransferase class III-fold pyridoxal phosphate-dependent enzyme [Agrobacterium tumefaciens]NTC93635.1 aminotransferase class III-fold pyridoxal phosphate-dependent enzyme
MNTFPGSPTSSAAAAAAIITAFNRKTEKSKAASARNQRVLSDKSSIGAPFSLLAKEAFYPIVVQNAEGAYLRDIDGNRYVDVLMGMGINLFGHNPPFIRAAIEAQLDRGFALGPQSDLAGETAELFCKLTGKDRVTFTNTGTEAVMTALRISRAATGRRRVAMFIGSYHGHSDQVLNRIAGPDDPRAVPAFPGISPASAEDVLLLPYDDQCALETLEREGETLAAVLVEPVQSRNIDVQPRAFLHMLRDVTQRTGAVLLFDEMISGFRVAPGGAQAHFGIEADLATYGKIAGGGLPLALIAGNTRLMNHIDGGPWSFGDDSVPPVQPTFFAGTYCRHPLALAAARAVAVHMLEQGPALQEGLNARTRALVDRLNKSLAAAQLPVVFTQFGSFFSVAVNRSRIPPLALGLLSLELLTAGIHLRGGDKGGFLSTAHSDDDIAAIHDAILTGLQSLAGFGLFPLTDGTTP